MDASTIAGKTFSTVRKGWKPEEVRGYLDTLAYELISLFEENNALRGEIRLLESRLQQSLDMEKRVRSMLAEMKRATEELAGKAEAGALAMSYRVEQERKAVVEQARREADVIIRDAEKRAERLATQGNARLAALQEQIDLLETKKIALITRIKSILRAHVDFLAALEHSPQARTLRNSLRGAMRTREGIDAEDLTDIIERLE